MVLKPLDIRTERIRPKLRRMLGLYERGTRVEEIAILIHTSTRMVYHWLYRARELREQGRLDD